MCGHGDFEKGEMNKMMNSHVMQGKNEKFLKTVLEKTLKAQNAFFATGVSHEQVASASCQKLV